jgi:hypothetical protein
MAATTIDEVLLQLEKVITDSLAGNRRVGYFAALYYKVTASVKEGIAKGQFDNSPLMEKFDVLFANRYLDALSAWDNGGSLKSSWQVAFAATQSSSVLVLQQLLLGMNAHINLDLGIAAVEVSGGNLNSVKKDFDAINAVISALTYQVMNDISCVSPLLSLLGLHASNQSSVLIQFSIDNARDGAWCFAEDLVNLHGDDYTACIAKRDQTITQLAQNLVKASGFMGFTLRIIHLFEWKKPSAIIRILYEQVKQKIVVN